jgi:hypothetical protein
MLCNGCLLGLALALGSARVAAVAELHAQVLIGESDSHFGTYIEGIYISLSKTGFGIMFTVNSQSIRAIFLTHCCAGLAVDGAGNAYALNYLLDFEGRPIRDIDARTTLGQINVADSKQHRRDSDAPAVTLAEGGGSALALRGTSGSWNGAR